MKKDTTNTVTGRDGFIMAKALAYAIITIERLPERWQDMKALLDAMTRQKPDYFLTTARSHIERRGVEVVDGQLAVGDHTTETLIEGVFPAERKPAE